MSVRDDILRHILLVKEFIFRFEKELHFRGEFHDSSKLSSPEIEMYDTFSTMIQKVEFEFGYGSPEYEQCIKDNWRAFKTHFQTNRHHPEHFPNGINDMNLVDIVEMFCDWKAASMKRGKSISLEANQKRFNISDQLIRILENTIRDFGW